TVSFNAWRHDNEDSLWAAFALNFIDKLSSQQSRRKRWKGHIELLSSRFNWKNLEVLRPLAIWLILIGISITAFGFLILKGFQELDPLYDNFIYNISNPKQLISAIIEYGFIALGGVAASIGIIVSAILKLKNTVGSPFDVDFSKYFNAPDYESRVDFIENFHKDFENIVKAYAGENKVYVFIDDLDRCEVPKAADLMQAINLMISYDPHLIFIVGMDRERVAASIAVKHEKLLQHLFSADSESNDTSRQGLKYGYAFIEKFIQVPFSVPQPTNDDFEKFLEDISENAEKIDTKSDKIKDLLKTLKEYLKIENAEHSETDENKSEGANTGDETPEDKARKKEETKIEEMRQTIILELNRDSKRIKDIILMIAPALDNNPRRIKQFINLFRLRIYIAVQTGLFHITEDTLAGEKLTPEQLGKFVAISLKWPLLLNDLDSDRSLLAKLQEAALNSKSEMDNHWFKEEKLMELLRFGLIKNDSFDTSLESDVYKYSLSELNVDKLLQVSPQVNPAEKYTEGDVGIENTFDPMSIKNMDMKFTRIEVGEFMMGSPKYEEGRIDNEGAAHKVTISKPFDLGTYPVTQREWKAVMGNNPSVFKGDDLPVENVSWNDVQEFIIRLNNKEGTERYRLPSEAEWEYACRAGETKQYSFGDGESMLGEYAWYNDNSGSKTHPVGQKKSNKWGLYDMHGNVWEWVQDKWHDNYKGSPTNGSVWESGVGRVFRGGSWKNGAKDCRSSIRDRYDPGIRRGNLGFRLLRLNHESTKNQKDKRNLPPLQQQLKQEMIFQ
ncbi:MAG: SUMF1/EgtB/PvdO family nonheme iron enzyme, partial [Candidatus Heimdallarchaeota archaeon]|nr:SUMF1/EgtB/PvdO family nonheme iron enzyme [Candidatus Heimdallarchaeota archaeon]